MGSSKIIYDSVDEIIETQNARKNDLIQAVAIIEDQKHLQHYMQDVFGLIDNVKRNINILQMRKREIEDIISKMDHCKNVSGEIQSKISYIENNLPNKFNKLPPLNVTIENENCTMQETCEENELTPLPSSKRHLNFADSFTFNSAQKDVKNHQDCEIQYITIDEFESIPRYMRGRVTYDTLNLFIEKINACIKEKYEFISSTRADKQKKIPLKRGINEKYSKYIREDTLQTKGKKFITEEDLKIFLGGKMDKQTLNFLPMLRHVKRLEVNRDGGLVRYVALYENGLYN